MNVQEAGRTTGALVEVGGRHGRRWLLIGIAALAAAGVLCVLLLCRGPSVDERLAAIEASRAIPDTENAAVLYREILERWGTISVDMAGPGGAAARLASTRPWRGQDHPELAWWLDEHEGLLAELRKATQREQCRLPLWIEPQPTSSPSMFAAMRGWAYLMVRSMNRDIGEGRTDNALTTCRSLCRLADHLKQQPTALCYMVGIAIEALTFNGISAFIVDEPAATNDRLDRLESFLLSAQDRWEQDRAQRAPIEELLRQKQNGRLRLIERLRLRLNDSSEEVVTKRIRELSMRRLSQRRGISILMALRRYKNDKGEWPETLAEIAPTLPAEILVDPRSDGPFLYKRTDDRFVLYGVGPNRMDEGGANNGSGADDWPIWLEDDEVPDSGQNGDVNDPEASYGP